MVYTSGTSGRPKGVRRPLTGADPDEVPPTATWFFGLFGLKPFDGHVHLCGSPLYHTAVLNFVTISIQLGHTVVLMDQLGSGRDAAPDRARTGSRTATWCPRSSGGCSRCPRRCATAYDVSSLRAMIHGAAPCPQEVKRRMLDWWGPVVVEYYAASEGGGTLITGRGVAATARLGRPGLARLGGQGPRRRTATRCRPARPGRSTCRWATSTFEYHRDAEKTRGRAGSAPVHRRRHRLPRRGRLPLPVRPQAAT